VTATTPVGPASPGPAVTDFASACCLALHDLHARVGLDLWLVVRRDTEDAVVLAETDSGGPGAGLLPQIHRLLGSLDQGPVAIADVSPPAADSPVAVSTESAPCVRALIAAPLPGPDGHALGTLCGIGLRPHSAELARQLPTVQVAAGLLGPLLGHELRMLEEARRAERTAGGTDALTGPGDARAWERMLAVEETRARRYGTPVSVICVEVSSPPHQHAVADDSAAERLLTLTADALTLQTRAGDLVARLSGETFGILLPDTGAVALAGLQQRLRLALAGGGVPASIGSATCRPQDSLEQAWRDAVTAASSDARARRAGAPPATTGTPVALPAPGGSARPDPGDRSRRRLGADAFVGSRSIDALLELGREQLGMDVALLGEFRDDEWLIRSAVSSIDLPVRAGFVQRRNRTHCDLLLHGRIGSVVVDSTTNPLTAELPGVTEWGLRSYVGVPVHRRGGALWGSLCVLARVPDHRLTERDAGVLRVIAAAVAEMVENEEHRADERRVIEARFAAMYAAGGPQPVYQPILELDSLRAVGIEALSRFPTSERAPEAWFADAAAAGLDTDLELTALVRALQQAPAIDGFLSVNISPTTAMSARLLEVLDRAPVNRLVLELTEHHAIDDYEALLTHLAPARATGLRLAVDDAGAGYASLRHVLALTPDLIKLDRSLVSDIGNDPVRAALAAALTTFADQTGSRVVAEGIETAEELAALNDLGVHYGQGYHLGRPAPAAAYPATGYAGPERRHSTSPGAPLRGRATGTTDRAAPTQRAAPAARDPHRRRHQGR
jgi:EAL domain-containing protein (putative c-di-GMP-specific phosphodiesterase class I)/GGDEF domain-containing protein